MGADGGRPQVAGRAGAAVDAVTRAELLREHPPVPVTCLGDLPAGERVWTCSATYGEAAHQRAPGRVRVAVCGVALSEFPTTVDGVAHWGGDVCRAGCWPTETPTGVEPVGDKERTSE